MNLRRLGSGIAALVMLLGSLAVLAPTAQAADTSRFNPGYIVSDEVFYNSNTMSLDQIQQFLVSKVPTCDTNGTQPHSGGGSRAAYAAARGYSPPFTCLKDYRQTTTAKPADAYCSGFGINENQMAAQILYNISKSCGINPQVLIALLQKEQGLVTDDWPWTIQYRSATGMGCPDTAACDSQYYGFFNQVYGAARQYKMYRVNANSYSYVAGRNNYIQWNPQSSCGGSTVYIANQATAGLYNYTPYRPNQAALNAGYGSGDSCSAYGNRNFWLYFSDWFGSPTGDSCLTNISGATTDVAFSETRGQRSTSHFIINSGTSTGCIEFHSWNAGFNGWRSNLASNSSSINPANAKVMFADIDGDGSDEAILVAFRNTGSGKVEFHVWDSSLRKWRDNIVSNASTIDPAISTIRFADLDGDGRDEGVLVGQANGSTSTGKIELHVWQSGFGSWRDHYITNSSTLDVGISSVDFADLDGDGRDSGVVIGQGNGSTSTGRIEFHVWSAGFGSWSEHYESNSSTLDPSKSKIIFTDRNGDRRDEGVLVGQRSPTGSGMIEFHVWSAGFGSWSEHSASNQTAPSQ